MDAAEIDETRGSEDGRWFLERRLLFGAPPDDGAPVSLSIAAVAVRPEQ
jgi:hypothetical protein